MQHNTSQHGETIMKHRIKTSLLATIAVLGLTSTSALAEETFAMVPTNRHCSLIR